MPDTPAPACPTCGTPPPPGSPGGACPRCLLAAGLESGGPGDRSAPPSPEEMSRHFPHLEVLEVLGQGGMGIVYRARHRNLDRMVALKVLPPEAAREPGFPERFTREARTLARLQHPHIVAVHDFGETGGLYWLVMEFVDGPNLRQVLREGGLEPAQALAIVPQVCDALQYAHGQGIVHRDIKPENLLLDRSGNVKIADFGLARMVQRAPVDLTLTREGQVMGTLHYMAPEQYRSPDTVDHRADIYSLGVVFYEMLTGELPMGVFPPPSRKAGVDARLDAVVMRALEKERDRRWQQASEVRTQVDSIAAGPAAAGPVPAAAAPAPAAEAAEEERKRMRVHVHGEWKDGDPDAPLSRMAVAAGLGVPLALALGGAAWAITESLTHGEVEDALCPRAAAFTAVATLLVATVLGIASWVRIHRAAGRLRGLGWAVAGSLLNPFVLCLGVPAALLVTPPSPPPLRFLGGRYVVDRGIRGDRIPGAVLPGETGRARDVRGGPHMMGDLQREWVAREMDDLWRVRGASLLHQMYLAGEEGRLPSAWSVRFVALAPDGWSGRVVVSDGRNTLAFPAVHDGNAWSVPEGDREARPGPPVDEDRDGRILDGEGTGGGPWLPLPSDPGLVTLAPARMTDGQKIELVDHLRSLWNRLGKGWLEERFPGTGRGARAAAMRLAGVQIRADGLAGRMVWTDGAAAVAVPVEAGLGSWWISSSGGEWFDRSAEQGKWEEFLAGGMGGGGWPSPPEGGGRTPAPPDAALAADACLVHGAPAGTGAEALAAVARAVRALWREKGPEYVRRTVPSALPDGQPMRIPGNASDYTLFAVALAEDGRSGRAVLGNGSLALSVPLERDGEVWVLGESGWQTRFSPPSKQDEDGDLFR